MILKDGNHLRKIKEAFLVDYYFPLYQTPIYIYIYIWGFLGVLPIVLSQSYVKHDLRKNKIVVLFFC